MAAADPVEGKGMRVAVSIDRGRCTGCGYCLLTCPRGAISSRGWAQLDASRCDGCGRCATACPNGAISAEGHRPPSRDFGGPYDHVVVGAGIGGLMAAAALARGGSRVAVFEQLRFPGEGSPRYPPRRCGS